jgi:hypothetical protein
MMALDSCNIQTSSRSSTLIEANGRIPQLASQGKRKTSNPQKKNFKSLKKKFKNLKKKIDARLHVNGVHSNTRPIPYTKPIPYVPVEPKPNSEAKPSVELASSRTGECTSCGRKNVLVSMPPMSRCTDYVMCEEIRKLIGIMRSGKPVPVTKRAIVCTERHRVPYYLKTVYYKTRELKAGEIVNAPTSSRVIEKTIGEALELVREKSEATKFPPDKANQLAAIWGAVAKEV